MSGVVLIALPAQAKRFSNAYISFDLPPNWTCQMEGTEWVCISKFAKKAKEAMIILTAKERGPANLDSLEAYHNHLKQTRMLPDSKGRARKSEVKHVTIRNIANHRWADGLHLGSEITSYYTRYLATVKDRIGILVTFSAHKTHYTKYSTDFINAIKSLRVTATKDLLAKSSGEVRRSKKEFIGGAIGQAMQNQPVMAPPEESSSGLSDSGTKLLGLVLLLAAVGFYLYSRKKKGQGSRPQKNQVKRRKK